MRSDWTPPDDPDPSAILDEAQADAQAGHYDDSLAKYVWYHNHALEYQPSLRGVRLSFALAYWNDLSENYPPALQAMRDARDAADAELSSEGNAIHAFRDLTALNGRLGDTDQTLTRFLELHFERPHIATRVYVQVEDLLVEAKHFEVCQQYVEPQKQFSSALELHKKISEAKEPPGPALMPKEQWQIITTRLRKQRERRFIDDVLCLLKILVANDRNDEAAAIATKARAEIEYEEHSQMITAALEDQVDE